MPEDARRRRPRRAVGPTGAVTAPPPDLGLVPESSADLPGSVADAERYRREQPPHHDRGV